MLPDLTRHVTYDELKTIHDQSQMYMNTSGSFDLAHLSHAVVVAHQTVVFQEMAVSQETEGQFRCDTEKRQTPIFIILRLHGQRQISAGCT